MERLTRAAGFAGRSLWIWLAGLLVVLIVALWTADFLLVQRAQPGEIIVVPTFTNTPGVANTPDTGAQLAAAPVLTATQTVAPTLPPTATQTDAPTAPSPADAPALLPSATPLPAPVATPLPADPPPTVAPANPDQSTAQLALGAYHHRIGDYMLARSELAALLGPETARDVRLQAQFLLVKAYLADSHFAEALAGLDALDTELAQGGDTGSAPADLANRALYLRAEALAGLSRHAEAADALNRFVQAYPWAAVAVQPGVAQVYLAMGDTGSAAAAYRVAADAAPDTVARVTLLEEEAAIHSQAGRFADAAAVYDMILAVAQNAGYRAIIQNQAGQALAAAGNEAAAIEHWRAATDEAPSSSAAYEALVELVNRNVPFDLYQRGVIDLAAEAWAPAATAFQAYVDSVAPDDARYAAALHGLAQGLIGTGDYATALAHLTRVVTEFSGCACFGQAWLDTAQAQAGSGDGVAAHRTYRTFARDFPTDPLAAEALWQSGLLAISEGSEAEAAVDFLALADAFPASERAPLGLYLVGMGALRNGMPTESASVLGRLQQQYPDYRWDAVGYWLGRAQQAKSDGAAAVATWQALGNRAPDIYYGVLANQALAQLPPTAGSLLSNVAAVAGPPSRLSGDDGSQAFAESWLANWLQVDPVTVGVLPAEIAADPDLAIGRLLLDLDDRGNALVALQRVYDRNRDNAAVLYPLALEFERLHTYRLSLLSIARLLQFSPAGLVENAPIFLQRMAYPEHFEDLIVANSQTYGIDPLVFFSLIRQESLFEEGARSHAAAQGLAQIIPDTGAWIAEQLAYPGYTNELVYRPVINVRFGTYYLDWVRDYLDGNLVAALSGYNAGPGNAKRWVEQAGNDDTMFVELMDITEPRIYIQAITSNLYHYTRLYGP